MERGRRQASSAAVGRHPSASSAASAHGMHLHHHSAAAMQYHQYDLAGGAGGCGVSSRPVSASRKKPPMGAGAPVVGGAEAQNVAPWPRDRRNYSAVGMERPPPSVGGTGTPVAGGGALHGGLTRQFSAPSLAAVSHGGAGTVPNVSFDSLGARHTPPAPPSGGNDVSGASAYAWSPALRRAASASSVGPRGGGVPTAPLPRSGFTSSVPRRRPYETTPVRGAEHGGRGDSLGPPARPSSGAALHQRADALQLESRLTERLREHSLSSAEATRRPGGSLPGAAPHGSAGGSRLLDESNLSHYGGSAGLGNNHSHHHHGQPPQLPGGADGRYSTPGSTSHHNRRSGASPAPCGHGDSFFGRSPPHYYDRLGSDLGKVAGLHRSNLDNSYFGRPPPSGGSGGQRPPHQGGESFLNSAMTTPHHGPHGGSSATGMDEDTTLPESRLKIYSDLFEEVIERDRVFGSLLRKIKTAYDMLLLRGGGNAGGCGHEGSMLQGPHDTFNGSRLGGTDGHRTPEHGVRSYGGTLHSNEPTTRNEAWEMQRENRALKDLVERLHLELEEAVRREQRWKQKATRLKARGDTSIMPPMPTKDKMGYETITCGLPAPPPEQMEPEPPSKQISHQTYTDGSHMCGLPAPAPQQPHMQQQQQHQQAHHAAGTHPSYAGNHLHGGSPSREEASPYQHHQHHTHNNHYSPQKQQQQQQQQQQQHHHHHHEHQQHHHHGQPGHQGQQQPSPPQYQPPLHQHLHQQQISSPHHSNATTLLPEANGSAAQGAPGAPNRAFHALRREPSLEVPEGEVNTSHDAPGNQGGLLSLSSISPQTSPPPPVDSMQNSCQDSARSTDSGMLPQRPTRRIIIKPDHVPTLDFSRLHIGPEEEEEEMVDYEEGQAQQVMLYGAEGQEQVEYMEDEGFEGEDPRGQSFLE
eukprot:TRINITY_DN3109_c0_g2_i1.p1 TRINITY_DN3109_c0_g2~~TRINITY_DN3109_c0_g2_i1.p1  ORF type:complete len:970 (-),score=180.60 TRINITY_DN3109_c0_g2_i1:28-2784(-)